MAKQQSRWREMKSGNAAPGCWKGNGPSGKVSVAASLRKAASQAEGNRVGSVRGPAGQDVKHKTGGASDSAAHRFRGASGYKYD